MSCQPPTLILCHATVLTMEPTRPRAEAIALRAGRIVAVGTHRRGAGAARPQLHG